MCSLKAPWRARTPIVISERDTVIVGCVGDRDRSLESFGLGIGDDERVMYKKLWSMNPAYR